MSAVGDKVLAVRNFLGEVNTEMHKSVWPERRELVDSTFVVIISMLLLSAFIGVSDRAVVSLLKLIIPSG